MHVNVFGTLLGHRGLPLRLPRLRGVIVTDKNGGLRRQSQHFVNGAVQRMGVAARKIRACCAYIGHKQGVSHKNSIFNSVSHVCRGVAWHQHGHSIDVANLENLPIFEQMVKLPAIG